MLSDMVQVLVDALRERDSKAIRQALKNMEKVGIDRKTALVMAGAVIAETKEEQ